MGDPAGGARAEAVVDLAAVRHNVALLAAGAPGAALMAVVKADGYGHGAEPVARAALAAGASWLGVCTLDEALALRAVGIDAPLLCWLHLPGEDFAPAVAAGIDLSVSSRAHLAGVLDGVTRAGRPARIHLKIDTGLSRNGAPAPSWEALVDSAAKAAADGTVEVIAVWSHLANADLPAHPTNAAQADRLTAAWQLARDRGLEPIRHLANSAATMTRPDLHFDLVRPGIAVYGLDPLGRPAADSPLRPAMTLRARVVLVKRVPAGEGVSYGHQWTTPRETTLALLPIGYADGVPRRLGQAGRMRVWLGGALRPVVGRVCMDQIVVDCGDEVVREGDQAVLFGPGAAGEPTAQDWADELDTIHYEIVTGVHGQRVTRNVHTGPTRVKPPAWGAIAGAAGATVAGIAVGVLARKTHQISAERQRLLDGLTETVERPTGEPSSVTADDGVRLSCEEIESAGDRAALTVVLVHGFALDRRTWHFQRSALAELTDPTVRLVIYDLRSHGKSERAPRESCTLDQLGQDLAAVIRALAPDGPLVLVGHSMGGMTLMALAELHPELFAERVAGVALIATSASEIGSSGLSGSLLSRRNPLTRTVGLAARFQPKLVEGVRRAAGDVIWAITRSFAYGDRNVAPWLVDLVDTMISANAVDALTDFVDTVGSHDRIAALPALADCEVLVAAGDAGPGHPVHALRADRARATPRHPAPVPRLRAPAHARTTRDHGRRAGRAAAPQRRPSRPVGKRPPVAAPSLTRPAQHRSRRPRNTDMTSNAVPLDAVPLDADPTDPIPLDTPLELPEATDTEALGQRLARGLGAGDLVVLAGPLGAGKTVLVRGLARGLGVAGPITSPTFVIAREHRPLPGGAGVPLVHVDAYRLGSTGADVLAELDDLDLDTDLDSAVLAVEWGEGVAERLSARHLLVRLDRRPDDVRVATVRRVGPD